MAAPTLEPGTTHVSQPRDTDLQMVRVFAAPRTLIWAVHTIPAHVQQWLLGPDGWTMPICEIDLRVGGAWRYVWRKDNGKEMEMTGNYREIDPPRRLVWTERWGGPWPETLNIMELVEEHGRTTMTVTVRAPDKKSRDAAMETGMMDGVNATYARLDRYLSTLTA